jgi:F-type H+-transporting ATPase subunit delta
MKGSRAAVRYAKAFKQLSVENNLLDTVIEDIRFIHLTIESSRDLELMLRSPLIKMGKKRAVVKAVFEGKIHASTLNFLDHIVQNARENILSGIAESFIKQYNEIKNIASVSVTTSQAMKSDLKESLLASLKTKYSFSQIELEEKVDADLIGGMVLRIGDKQLDASIRRQLNDIKQELVHA